MQNIKQIKNYIVRQNNWLKANNIKPGDKLRVTKKHPSESKGWGNIWVDKMDDYVGKKVTFISSFPLGIRLEEAPFAFPYTVLQKL